MKTRQWIYKSIKIFMVMAAAQSVLAAAAPASAQNRDLAAEIEHRAGMIQTIVDTWQHSDDTTSHSRWRQRVTRLLQRLSTDDLKSALDAASYSELTALLQDSDPASAGTSDFASPLLTTGKLYYPLDPCRIVNTKNATGAYTGPVGQGVTANYHAKDSVEIESQGGLSGGCSVPAAATALVLNITAVDPAAKGHLRAFPYAPGVPMPTASIVNFTVANIANATILPICEGTCDYDFSIYASQSTHVIVDVMGYFAD